MFDLTSSKLLILAIVALIVVGPKDLPILLRTVGKYLGIVRRHANEFRAQLDEALREAELHDLKKEFDDVGRQMRSTIEEGAARVDRQVETTRTRGRQRAQGKVPAGREQRQMPAASSPPSPRRRPRRPGHSP